MLGPSVLLGRREFQCLPLSVGSWLYKITVAGKRSASPSNPNRRLGYDFIILDVGIRLSYSKTISNLLQ